jgi:hypothetical protein
MLGQILHNLLQAIIHIMTLITHLAMALVIQVNKVMVIIQLHMVECNLILGNLSNKAGS